MRKIYQYILMAVAMVATASCSNELDETLQPVGNGNLQFVVSDFPAFDEGTATRAVGTPDAGKTAWADGDEILVHLHSPKYGDHAATLTFKNGVWGFAEEGTLTYLDKEEPTITAVYAPDCKIKSDKTIGLKEGKQYGMAEYILAKTDIRGDILELSFDKGRKYSRLRIVAEPLEELTVTTGFTPAGASEAISTEYTLTADANGNAYLYGTFAASGTVEVKGKVTTQYTFTEATDAGNSYALFARRGANLAKLTSTYIINDSETHYFYGSGNYGIRVLGVSPTIVLCDANISLKDGASYSSAVNAINIEATGISTTIRVEGEHNSITTKQGAGIFVEQNSNVVITSSTLGSKLKINATGGAAIGGYSDISNSQGVNCGHFTIKGITLEAQSNSSRGFSAAIGSSGSALCGTIKIENAIVYAYGSSFDNTSCAPAIGLGMTVGGMTNNTLPTINIQSSEIHLYRGGTYADYIGKYRTKTITDAGLYFGTNGAVRNSKLYCYTGANATDSDAVIQYDMDGNVVNN